MFKWAFFPFVRITFFLSAGILTANWLPEFRNSSELALILLFLTYLALLLLLKRKSFYNRNYILGSVCLLWFFTLGYHLYSKKRMDEQEQVKQVSIEKVDYYLFEIYDIRSGKNNVDKIYGRVTQVQTEGEWRGVALNILVNIREGLEKYKTGQRLLVKGRPKDVQEPRNPAEFNYKQFLSQQSIYVNDFVSPEKILIVSEHTRLSVRSYSIFVRQKIENVFRKFFHRSTEREVLVALVLGDKSKMDDHVQEAYISAGAMHILAVSGLHVGIIYSMLYFILAPLRKKAKLLYAFTCILILGFYAFVTGLSASVSRAVLMTSLVIISQILQRKANIYNTLAVTAFIILTLNPYLLFSVGFQLSFAAVLGIIYLQPKVYHLFVFEAWLLDTLWKVCSVTIAAQIAVVPLALYYFHVFPLYFLIANLPLFVIAYILLTLGFLLIFISSIPFVPSLLAVGLEWAIKATNYWVMLFKNPLSSLENIYINGFQTFLIYLAIISFLFFLNFRKLHQLLFFFLVILSFTVTSYYLAYQNNNEKQVVFYSIGGGGVLGLFEGKNYNLFAPGENDVPTSKLNYHVKPHFIEKGIYFDDNKFEPSLLRDFKEFKLLVWNRKIFVLINKPINEGLEIPFFVDYILISNNSLDSFAQLKNLAFKVIIMDNTNSSFKVAHLMKEASEKGFNIHSLSLHGAFVDKLNEL